MAGPAPKKWHKLDNTANLFPVIAGRDMSNVFRLSAVLTELVEPTLLQRALEETLPHFAAFHVRLRHGLFWSYLEQNDARPQALPEEDEPCRYIDPLETGRFLFRVVYFRNRVSLETFHVLTDGTGALRFLKALCYRYCQLTWPSRFSSQVRETLYGLEQAGNVEDGYLKNYIPVEQKVTYKEARAWHVHGERREGLDTGVVTLLLPVDALKAQAHTYGASVGEYLTAVLMCGLRDVYLPLRGTKRPTSIFVPVDLRRIFGTDTSANFFAGMNISVAFNGQPRSFADVVGDVKAQFAEKLTEDAFRQKLAYTASSEVNPWIRMVPLPLKNGIMRLVYEGSSMGSTTTFSNLGPVAVEPAFAEYFEGFRFLLSTTRQEPIKCTACAYGNTLALTFMTQLTDNALACAVARQFTGSGIQVIVESGGDLA